MSLLLSACTPLFLGGYGANNQTKEEFTRYVEDVFRLQNSMTSEMMLLQETEGINNGQALFAAEQQMQKACVSLNEYAARENDDASIGLLLQRRVQESAHECEQAALKLKALLKK
ncbi:MAG: hypothetical protein NTV43_04545 [Methylococcales bacterium]|nr:hypothetical protein [Methylococcales bacterium]